MKWPLGINPEMDEHAIKQGLAHWSCVSPNSNDFWVRRDGFQHYYDDRRKTCAMKLEELDAQYSIREDFAMFSDVHGNLL
jgi:hypothetical protein